MSEKISWDEAEQIYHDERIINEYRNRDGFFPELSTKEGGYQVAIMKGTLGDSEWAGRMSSGEELPKNIALKYDLESLIEDDA